MNTNTKHRFLIKLMLFMILSLWVIMPFTWSKGSLYGDDLHFHLMRMESFSNILQSPINFKTFYHSGQAINLFYPSLLYYPYYLFYKLIGHFWIAWIVYLFLLTNVTLYIAYRSAKLVSNSRKVGITFALLYGFNAYRSHNILFRFAVGEFISSAILPLVFSGFYLLIKTKGKRWLPLAIGMTLLIYSHVMSAIIATVILAILSLLTFFKWQEKVAILLAMLKAALVTLVLTAAFWIPMLEQFLSVKISGVTRLASHLNSLPISEILTSNLKNDILSHHIGLAFMIMLIFVIVRFRSMTKLEKLAVTLGLFFFVSTTTLLNWDLLTFLHQGFIQLPWRFNTYATLFIAYATASQFRTIKSQYLLALPVFIIGLHLVSVQSAIVKLETAPVRFAWTELSYRNNYDNLTKSVFVPDYTNFVEGWTDNIAPGDPRWNVVQTHVFLNESVVSGNNQYSANQATFTVTNPYQEEATLYLPIYFYKGQEVRIDGQKVKSQLSPWASTQVQLPHGQHQVTVKYHYTLLARVAQILSLFGLVALWHKKHLFKTSKKQLPFQKTLV